MLGKKYGKDGKVVKQTKTCKNCSTKTRLKGSTLCYGCLRKKERERRLLSIAKKKERKLKSKTYQNKTYKTLFRKAWKVFSEWVRQKSADWKGFVACYTCGRMFHWKEMHAGHRYHGRLDLDERNVHPQCVQCNTYLHGNLGEYERHIIREMGQEGADSLNRDANIHPGYGLAELEEIILKYSNLKF